MKYCFCLFLLFISVTVIAQTTATKGKSFRISSHYAMFPDALRNTEPRVYEKKTYSTLEHYSDSSAYIFIPDYFDKDKPYEFVLWFHGWGNTIDSALVQYQLKEQFYAAHRNAIFIFPEGPTNAPDSYGGKFEKPDTFNYFMNDVQHFLLKEKIITLDNKKQSIMYAGHSGAYRVMSYLLLQSKYNCKAILLFDALYGELEKFTMYLQQHPFCKLIDIYTDNGGTLQNSKNMMLDMDAWHWKYFSGEEATATTHQLQTNRIVFLHSSNKHNDVVNNFTRFLQAIAKN